MRKVLIFLISIILVNASGCSSKNFHYTNGCDSLTDFYNYYCDSYDVELTNVPITLEKAKECYVSMYPYVYIYPPHPYNISEYIGYKHTLIYEDEHLFCFEFDIDGYDDLKWYSFITKDSSNLPENIQTLFIDKNIAKQKIDLIEGDNISKLKEVFHDAQNIFLNYSKVEEDLKNKLSENEMEKLFPFQECYEILDENGIFRYEVNTEGTVISKKEIDVIGKDVLDSIIMNDKKHT